MRRPATSSPCLRTSPAWSWTQRREFAQNPCREPLLARPRGAMLERGGGGSVFVVMSHFICPFSAIAAS